MSTSERRYDRREIFAAAAGAAAAACVPFSSLATPALRKPRVEPLADWSIDDQWGVVPRWDAIPFVPQHRESFGHPQMHPADAPFVP